MSRPGPVPRSLLAALRPPPGKCYRHCDRVVRPIGLKSPLPGTWTVYACPSGVVSVTSYVERARRDPTARVSTFLARRTRPASLVRLQDLRLATRHGPELGRAAELQMSKGNGLPLRVVYWRVYPFQARDGTERRLFVCAARSHRDPVFFAAAPDVGRAACPSCAPR